MAKRRKKRNANARERAPVARRYLPLLAVRSEEQSAARRRLREDSPAAIKAMLARVPAPHAARVILGLSIPKKYGQVFRSPSVPRTNLLSEELKWLATILPRFAFDISWFLRRRDSFERALVVGELKIAETELTAIRGRFGVSLWLLDAELLLAEETGGLGANRDLLKSVRASSKRKSYVNLLARFLSQRAERGSSYANYSIAFESFARQFAGRDDLADIIDELRLRAHLAAFKNTSALPFVLWHATGLPIVDQYETFVLALQIASASSAEVSELEQCAKSVAASIEDIRLDILLQFFDPSREIRATSVNKPLAEALDSYTAGDYARSNRITAEAVLADPSCLELHELCARSHIAAKTPLSSPFVADCLANTVLTSIHRVLERDSLTLEALDTLRAAANRFQETRIGRRLLYFVQTQGISRPSDTRLSALNASSLTPRHSVNFLDQTSALTYLGALCVALPVGPTLQLFTAIHSHPNAQFPAIPATRRKNYVALAYYKAGQHDLALAEWRPIVSSSDATGLAREAAVVGAYSCLIALNQLNECVRLVVTVHLERPSLLISVPIETLVTAHRREPSSPNSDSMAWAILYHINYQRASRARNTEQLSILVDDALLFANVRRPSELRSKLTELDLRQLLLFLREVCTLDVLDYSFEYDNTDDLHNERVAICQLLIELDPAAADACSQEIFRLVQGSHLRRALQHIAEAKVGIDFNGLKASLGKTIRERYERFASFSSLSDRQRESLQLDGIDLSAARSVLVITDEGRLQFEELFQEIKSLFLYSNEYGLDSCLSVRIRHGTLSGQLRSRFENENLITRKNAVDRLYDKNMYWSENVFSALGSEVDEACDLALRKFSGTVDSVIGEVKDVWIQVRGTSNDNRGLFDYEYSSDQLVGLYASVLLTKTYEEFVDGVLEELYKRTQSNLATVVDQIKSVLTGRITTALDDLGSEVLTVDNSLRSSPFYDAVVRCGTHIQNELEAIAAWFRIPTEQSLEDFAAPLLIETAVATIRKCFPSFTFAPAVAVPKDLVFRGLHLVSLGDIMFLLLGNIVQHSAMESLVASITIAESEETVELVIANEVNASVSDELIRNAVREIASVRKAKAADGITRREGGSGFHKLHKIIKYDLDCGDDYKIDVEFTPERQFLVRVVLPRGEVAA